MTTIAAPIERPHDSLVALLERKRMIDGAWVVCLALVLAAVTLPWFVRALDVDLVRLAAAVFGYVVLHLLFSAATDRLRSRFAVTIAVRTMLVAGVVFLTALWHLAGGLANPVFLSVFALPVIMSALLITGSQTLLIALASIVCVIAAALVESADLRWYAAQLHMAGLGSAAAFGARLFPPVDAVAGFGSSPTYEFTVLVMFAAIQLTIAFVSRPLAMLLLRVNSRLEVSGKMLTEVQGLFHAVLRAEPEPAVIMYADTGQLIQASDSFFKRMFVRPSDVVGRGLFDLVQFGDPDRVRASLEAVSGELPFCAYDVHGETRVANVSFYRTEHQGLRCIYVGFQEVTELYYLQSAFDAVDDPLVVVAPDARLHYANRTAKAIFGDLYFGMELSAAPKLQALLSESSGDGDQEEERYRFVDGQPYDLRRLAAQLPGESGTCTIVWLHGVAKERALFEQAVRDPLTGAYNRRYFHDALVRHLGRGLVGRQLACAYFDLDDFKPINDRLGHAAGDAALIGFVNTVKSQLRAVDVLARLGGDEFAVLFVNCDLPIAEAAIARIRTLLTTDGWTFEGQSRPLSFSAGLAACHADDDVATLLERTDRAVYKAKRGGKGRSAVEA